MHPKVSHVLGAYHYWSCVLLLFLLSLPEQLVYLSLLLLASVFPLSLDLFVLTYGQIEGCVFSRIKSAHRALFLIYKQYFISIRVYLIEKASFLQTRLFHNRVVHKKMKAMSFLFFGINRHSYPMVFYQYFFWQTRKLYSDKKISCRS